MKPRQHTRLGLTVVEAKLKALIEGADNDKGNAVERLLRKATGLTR